MSGWFIAERAGMKRSGMKLFPRFLTGFAANCISGQYRNVHPEGGQLFEGEERLTGLVAKTAH